MDPLRHVRGLVIDCCAIATLATFVATVMTRTPAVVFVWAGIALITGPGVYIVARTHSPALFAAIALWGIGLPAWVLYARHEGQPWSARVIAALVIPASVLTCGTLLPALTWAREEESMADWRRRRREREKLARWERVLARYVGDGVRAVRQVDLPAGHDVYLELSGTVTIDSLRLAVPNLAVALKLKPSAVTFSPGAHAGLAVMHLDEADVMAEVIPFPEDSRRRTIRDPVPLGRYPNGEPMQDMLTETAIFIAGVTGSGKSNLLNVLIASFALCEDVILWVIDTKWRLAAPWIRPWVEHQEGVGAPAIDWVANTRGEAYAMLTELNGIIADRAASLKGGSKITPSPDTPAFVVIIDEVADLTAPQGIVTEGPAPAVMAALLTEITRKQRSEACPPVIATQRGTTDFMGRTAIKANCRYRMSLATSSRHEARSVTEIPAVARLLADAEHPGSVVIERPGRREPRLGKLFRLDPATPEDLEKIGRLAALAGSSRTARDIRAEHLMGQVYKTRWHRSPLQQKLLADWHERTGLAPIEPVPGTEAKAAVAQLDVGVEFAKIMTGLDMGPGKDSGGPRARYWALLAEGSRTQPVTGVPANRLVRTLAHETGVTKTTVYRWLAEDTAAGKLRKVSGSEDRLARYLVVPGPPGGGTPALP